MVPNIAFFLSAESFQADTSIKVFTLTGKQVLSLSTLSDQSVPFEYQLKNTTRIPYTVSRLDASCGCLAAVLQAGPESTAPLKLPVPLAPGQTLRIRATVQLNELRPGPFRKTISVYGRKADSKPIAPRTDAAALSASELLAVIEIQGTLEPPVAFARQKEESAKPEPISVSAPPIEMGRIPLVSTPESRSSNFILIATPDARLAEGEGEIPQLVSSHPAITVTPLPQEERGVLKYRVGLTENAPLGAFLATLSFAPVQPPPITGQGAERDALEKAHRRATAWRSIPLMVTGEVLGDLTASPQQLTYVLMAPTTAPSLANRPPDATFTRQVFLTANRKGLLADLKIESDNPLLTTTLGKVSPDGLTGTRERALLTITLSPDVTKTKTSAPNQPTTIRVRLTTKEGQGILLPVSVYVAPTPKAATRP